jgi:beta-galactosidase/beta-glucuronidase
MKKLTRRGFLRLTAGGLGALAGGQLVTGCRNTPQPTPVLTDEHAALEEAATPTATAALTLPPSRHPLVAIPADTVPLSGSWRFAVDPESIGMAQGWADASFDDGAWTEVTVPHTWGVMEAHATYDGSAWYRRTFTLPAGAQDAHLRLCFAAVFYLARVWLNGEYLGEHGGGYTPFEFDVRGIASSDAENTLAVQVDNLRTTGRIPATLSEDWSFDWWNYGGIVRDVVLEMTSRAYIARQQVVAVPHLVGIDAADVATVTVTAIVRNVSSEPLQGTLRADVMDDAAGLSALESAPSAPVTLAPGERADIQLAATLLEPKLWHFDHPHLYRSSVSLAGSEGELLHSLQVTFGVRLVELKKARFVLNGEPMRLVGLTRHADSPAHGLAETATVMAQDYHDLKALNMVFSRPVHYPQHEFILDYCDRNGILLIPEVPAWQLTTEQMADEQMRELERQQLREMIEASLNHPSIWAWSVGNEYRSETDAGRAFTGKMIAYVKTLDPTRPVGFASHRLGREPASDATSLADFVMMNQYFGTWHGPKDVLASVLDRIHALWPDKVVIISEYGFEPHWNAYWGPPSSSLDPSRYYLISERTPSDSKEADLQRQAVIAEQMKLFRSKPYVAAAVFWTYQDYRTPSGFVMGVVDAQRNRRGSWSLLRSAYAPLTIRPVVLTPPSAGRGVATVSLQTRGPLGSDMPAYVLRGYSLRWAVTSPDGQTTFSEHSLPLPTLEPGSQWQGQIEWAVPATAYAITVCVIRPTGFIVLEQSYDLSAASSNRPYST